jgi:SulP family sulfate permease
MAAGAPAPAPSFIELYTPKLVTVWREKYRLGDLRADLVAGLTVAIVALPLSMAIAIASGVTPDRGLYTSIVGGFLVSALGGSRFQIGGPAGAFIVLVAATVARFGVGGLMLATLLSGVILLAIGVLRLGSFIKYIPYPVTVGFTGGIAVVIFASQMKELLGLTLAGPEPGALIPKLAAIGHALPSFNPAALGVAVATVAVIIGVRRWRPAWPVFVLGIIVASVLAAAAGLHVATIGTRFGGIPRSLPMPRLPPLSVDTAIAVLPSALSFALLGSIESLLSAVVADSLTGRRHRSNAELVAQGVANIASSCFGGFCVTGTIARTATNVRAGARGPVSGMLHAVFLLLFMAVAAPLAGFIPLASLAAVLAVVCWNMVEKREVATLLRASHGDAVVLTVTFLLVVFRDLTTGIVVGFAVGALLFLHRMAQSVAVDASPVAGGEDREDAQGDRLPYDPALASDPAVVVFRISGAFFFGAAAAVGAALDQIGAQPRAYVIDFAAVPVIDSTAAATIEGFARKVHRAGAALYISGAGQSVRRVLLSHGVRPPQVRFRVQLADAVAAAKGATAGGPRGGPAGA